MKALKQSAFVAFIFGLFAMLAGPAAAQSVYHRLNSSVTFTERRWVTPPERM